jgi:hypothetical protein
MANSHGLIEVASEPKRSPPGYHRCRKSRA